jgi:hypothetical protein
VCVSGLTQLGVDYVTRQVPVAKEQRDAPRETTGSDTIPALVLQDGSTFIGERRHPPRLDRHVAEPPEAQAHRLKAAKACRRYLEEECECSQAPTP